MTKAAVSLVGDSAMEIDGKDGKDGEASALSPDFMSKLRAAEAKGREKPDPLQQLRVEMAALRDDMRELKDLMRLLVDGVERLVQAQHRSKISEDDLTE